MALWGSLCDIDWMVEIILIIEICYCKIVEYILMAFLDYYLKLLDTQDLADHYIKGSV